jgi:hypothetical protein
MKQYTIKITGSGTFEEISKALLAVAEELEFNREATDEPLFDIHWEDPTLYTEVTEDEQ